ncbi:MAG: glycosyltransferase family 2 protein [Sediminibacterium sp.]|jgi:dolichol-phosphate mannosyltransferase|nr:glycosyltransferase family 2 protein [Sediminibacterium sp.]
MKSQLAIVIPAYNEASNVQPLYARITEVMQQVQYTYIILFVNDGSSDHTLHELKSIREKDNRLHYISLSRNFGHQSALKAGLDSVEADIYISLDADLQHPPELIPQLLQGWEEGYDVVYTVREDPPNLSKFKKKTSAFFYNIMNSLSDIELDQGSADFRLMSSNVVAAFRQFKEKDLFIRGLVKWVGFKQKSISYTAGERYSGHSKYTFERMARFALQGITSFSTKPLYVATYLGFTFSMLSVLYLPYAIYAFLFGKVISGWTSLIVTVAFFGGLQLMILGIIGIYLGKLFMQSKHRPLYIIQSSTLS